MWYKKTAMILSAVGAINWGFYALGYNLVELLLGSWPSIEMIVYYIVAVCGIFALYKVFK